MEIGMQDCQRYRISGIFWIPGIANLKHWMFFSVVDVVLKFLDKIEVIPFSVTKQAQWWHVC